MVSLGVLAQAANTVSDPESMHVTRRIIETIWTQIQGLGVVEALTFISFGVVCLFYGWRIFKILVCICFALAGLSAGVWLNHYIEGNVIWLAAIFAAICAFFAVPLMRYGVSFLGAVAGGVLTTGLWLAFGLPLNYWWAGALVGVVAGGMLSFIVFKGSVMLFTSLGGSTLMITGILAICHLYIFTGPDKIHNMLLNEKWFLPVILVAPMLIGMYFQNKLMKNEQDWSL
ncbi:MAG: hypothetical protein K9N55_07150 [Phycisphaerae bacterium]|nr:hypothetical protein [Phycisphaerae bacterium]